MEVNAGTHARARAVVNRTLLAELAMHQLTSTQLNRASNGCAPADLQHACACVLCLRISLTCSASGAAAWYSMPPSGGESRHSTSKPQLDCASAASTDVSTRKPRGLGPPLRSRYSCVRVGACVPWSVHVHARLGVCIHQHTAETAALQNCAQACSAPPALAGGAARWARARGCSLRKLASSAGAAAGAAPSRHAAAGEGACRPSPAGTQAAGAHLRRGRRERARVSTCTCTHVCTCVYTRVRACVCVRDSVRDCVHASGCVYV